MADLAESIGVAAHCVRRIEVERPDLVESLHGGCWCRRCSEDPGRSMVAICLEEEVAGMMRLILGCEEADEISALEVTLCISMVMHPKLRFV